MKKIIILIVILFMFMLPGINSASAKGSDYMSYASMEFKNSGNKLLVDYTDRELNNYDEKINHKRFSGWNTYLFRKHQKVNYTSGIVFMYKNEGDTPSTYNFEYKEEVITKRSFNVTGSLDMSVKGDIKKLKAGLDTKLKIDYSETSTKTTRSSWSTKTEVDPGTTLIISIKGEGYIDQGVASKYVFLVRTKKGAFEIFNVATEYYCMEKVRNGE